MPNHYEGEKLVKLASYLKEYEAALIVSVLEENGIKAQSIGSLLGDFRAELPGYAEVLVFSSDLDRAKEILAEVQASSGGMEDVTENPSEESHEDAE